MTKTTILSLSCLALLIGAGCIEEPEPDPDPIEEPTPEPEPEPEPFNVEARTFGGDFEVGDSIDPTAEFPTSAVSGTYRVTYWDNLDANVITCQQTITWEGVVAEGFGVLGADCAGCSAVIDIPEDGWTDISDPTVDPNACDADELRAEQIETGRLLMTPAETESTQSFLQIALIDIAAAQALGLQLTQDGELTLEDMVTQFDDADRLLTHVGYISTTEGALAGLSGVAGASGEGEPYAAMWLVSRDPATNPETSPALVGAHAMGSIWVLQAQ